MQIRVRSATDDPVSTLDGVSTTDVASTTVASSTTAATSATTTTSTLSTTSTQVPAAASNGGYNYVTGGGIAATLILGFFIIGSGSYLGYLLYLKFQSRFMKEDEIDEEKVLSESNIRRLSEAHPGDLSKKGPTSFDDIVARNGKVLDKGSSTSRASHPSNASTEKAETQPEDHGERAKPPELPRRPSGTPHPRTPQQVWRSPRRKPPQLATRYRKASTSSPKLPTTPPSADWSSAMPSSLSTPSRPDLTRLPYPLSSTPPTTHPPEHGQPVRPTRPPRLSLLGVNRYTPHTPSPLSGRCLSPEASSAQLMNHPAAKGRRLSDLSPGLDPDYVYPMTPAQIGDGRPLEGLGRGGEEEVSKERRAMEAERGAGREDCIERKD